MRLLTTLKNQEGGNPPRAHSHTSEASFPPAISSISDLRVTSYLGEGEDILTWYTAVLIEQLPTGDDPTCFPMDVLTTLSLKDLTTVPLSPPLTQRGKSRLEPSGMIAGSETIQRLRKLLTLSGQKIQISQFLPELGNADAPSLLGVSYITSTVRS